MSVPTLRGATKARAPRRRSYAEKEGYQLFFMALPFLVLVLVFSYLPLWGWRYAFYDYQPGFKLENCEFVGFKWFGYLVNNKTQARETLRVLKNTFAISSLNILTSVLPIAFAVMLGELRSAKFKKVVQTFTTLPHFIGWVLIYSMAYQIFSYNTGVFNKALVAMGLLDQPINWLASGDNIWLKMCAWSVWKNIGWNAIIYLAAMAGIDQSLYEAATVDGAGRWRKIWHITIPGILPTFFVLLLMSVANFLNNGMEQYYVFQNAMTQKSLEVLDLYVYNIGIGNGSISLATVVSMLKSFVSLFLLLTVNSLSRVLRGESII